MSYQYKHIKKLDQEQSREIRDIVSRVLTIEPGYPPKQIWLEKQEGWVAVPIAVDEDYTYFASGLLRIAEDIGYQELPGLFLDTEVSEPVAFFVPSNIEAILEFKQEPLSNYKVFFAGAPNWVAVVIESDYYIVVGTAPTVEKFLDHSVNQAFTEFRNYLESWEFPKQFVQRLQPLKDSYWRAYRNTLDYQNASVGSRIDLFR